MKKNYRLSTNVTLHHIIGVQNYYYNFSRIRSFFPFVNHYTNFYDTPKISVKFYATKRDYVELGQTEANLAGTFLKPIETKYVYNPKIKPIKKTFLFWNIKEAFVIEELKNILELGSVYTVFIKVRYDIDNFFMVGNQFGFNYTCISKLSEVYDSLVKRLNLYMEEYDLSGDSIVYVELSFRKKDKLLLSEFVMDEKTLIHVDKKDIDSTKKAINIPISIDTNSLGVPLEVNITDGFVSHIKLIVDKQVIDILSLIQQKSSYIRKNHPDNITSFDSSYKFYLNKNETGILYVLAVKIIDENTVHKLRYSLNGVLVNRVEDIECGDFLLRKIGEKNMTIVNGRITKVEQNMKLRSIPKPRNNASSIEDNNIGVIDTETYRDISGNIKIYALGFHCVLDKEPTMYYINKDLDSTELVIGLVNELLRDKYSKIRFYCHNLGGYDIVFLLKTLFLFNETAQEGEKYKISLTMKANKILKCVITNNRKRLVLIDSYPILPRKLSVLAEDYNVETPKSKFPYAFSLKDNLNYVGPTPSISYYDNINEKEYNELFMTNWNFKDQTLLYLNNDLLCLYQVMTKVNKQVFMDYDTDLKDSLTVSSLAARIYLNNYYNNNIPTINKASMYKDIKEAYYGGITEVYKPYGENLYYYDVNSLYPYVAYNPMPGLECKKMTFYEPIQDISNLFGFFYCKIQTPKSLYLGLLPMRNNTGLTFPLGMWEGWYFSEELKFAQENGYSITVLKGYNFNKEYRVFDNYINEIYKLKANPTNKTQKSLAKSLLNNLLGRFGISLDKPITEVVTQNRFDVISMRHKIMDYKIIADNKIMVSYTEKLDYDIIQEHSLDITKILDNVKDHESQPLNITSIAISAAITAYARIHITKLKLDIINGLGGKIYYSDTDSIVTNIKLPENMIHSSDIGKLKLEHKIKTGIFISGKLYAIINDKNETIIKAKGFQSKSIKYEDFLGLLNNKNINHAIKTQSKTDWSIGHVAIDNNTIIINSNSYRKRRKLFDIDGRWSDTTPIEVTNNMTEVDIKYKQTFKWWYWCILPVAVLSYFISNFFFDDEEMYSVENTFTLSNKEHLYIENSTSELDDDNIKYDELSDKHSSKYKIDWVEWYEWVIDKIFGNKAVDFKPKTNIQVENTIYKDWAAHDNRITDMDNTNESLIQFDITHYHDKLINQCINEVIKKEKFQTFNEMLTFVHSSVENNDNYPETLKEKLIQNMEEKIYDLEIMALLVKEETHRLINPSNFPSEITPASSTICDSVSTPTETNNTEGFNNPKPNNVPNNVPNSTSGSNYTTTSSESANSNNTERELDKVFGKKAVGLNTQEFENRMDSWDEKERTRLLLEKSNEEKMLRDKYLKNKFKDTILRQKYIEALEDEDNRSPNSWNLKTRTKILGHDFAFQYFKSSDYREREKELDNRTDIEKDIQRSRHYDTTSDSPTSSTSKSEKDNEYDN